MNREHFDRWLRQIAQTKDHEISCSECFAAIDIYVEAEASASVDGAQWAPLRHHLDQCRVCREEYEILRDVLAHDQA